MSARYNLLRRPCAPALAVALLLAARSAFAVMDIGNNGAVLDAGRFAMRVTNIGVIGNAFFNKGLSYDPSFEFPRGSGHECLEHAELWVGAVRDDGTIGVSGGPMLEWRPTLDPNDLVIRRDAGDKGTRGAFDDDGDGKIDEELLDGRDNDGDGEVDEDIQFPAQETCAATYTDDTKEATEFGYDNGERHVPLGLSVVQEAHAWSIPGFDRVAGYQFTITNHSSHTLHEVRLGIYANLDSREAAGGSGHLDDAVTMVRDSVSIPEGTAVLESVYLKTCVTTLKAEFPAIHDASASSTAPWCAVIGLSHTTDPLGYITNVAFPGVREAFAAARAPRRDTAFAYSVFSPSLPPRQGGPPNLDADRFAALRGEYTQAATGEARDYSVLLSCGPFRVLEPGQSVEFAVAFIAGENADSLVASAQSAQLAWRGTRFNLQPDRTGNQPYFVGETGINGHEICYEPPQGVTFNYDPHCPEKFVRDPAYRPPPTGVPPGIAIEVTYQHGQPCIWSDFDCDACTGFDGKETTFHWYVQAPSPPQPSYRSTAGDREVTVEWDNLPELLADASVTPGTPYRFWGYRIYRLDEWTRSSLLPAPTRWQQIASFAVDTTLGARPLSDARVNAVDYDSIAYERKHYPVGRYRYVDERVLDGWDYHYVVTAVAQRTITLTGTSRTDFLESPFRADFSGTVRPRIESGGGTMRSDGKVWVVPNPFKAHAPWEREPVPGDAFTRHVDFFGMPKALARIRIYTLAGDLVQVIDHDGTHGDGEAPWNLISRNGQDIESGVYLFTVEWPGGHQVGRFVIIR
jgi:hypothetical protein